MVRREVFENIGLFDRQFEKQRLGDGEFGLRAYLHGFISISNPLADRLHLKAESGGLRQMGSWDAFRTTSWFAPRPVPSVLYLMRSYFGDKFSVLDLLIKVPMSITPFKYKGNYKLYVFGGVIAVLAFPLVLIQVGRSWQKSSVMLKEGPKIQKLLSH
jgi:GT2 family glycosyltransferase